MYPLIKYLVLCPLDLSTSKIAQTLSSLWIC